MDNLILAGALIFVLTAAMGAAVALFLGRNRFYRLRDYERVAVFHISGRFAGMRGPGFGFIGFNLLPPEGPPIDLRDQVDTIAAEQCITADSSVVNVAPVVVYKITDPGQMITEVKNPEAGIGSATIAALRAIIGTMTLQEVITGRETITAGMKERVSEQAQRWGISIIYVEIQSIRVSAEVERAMNERRAKWSWRRRNGGRRSCGRKRPGSSMWWKPTPSGRARSRRARRNEPWPTRKSTPSSPGPKGRRRLRSCAPKA